MYKSYKYRIYPSKEQIELLNNNFGCARFIYNKMLSDKIKYYKENKKMLKTQPAQYKEEFPFLKDVDSRALCNAQLNLEKAFNNFFRNREKFGFPNFKKKNNRRSYTTNNSNGTSIRIENNSFIRIPKLGSLINMKKNINISGIIKSCTISHTPSNRYYISISIKKDNPILPQLDNAIGIDLGIKTFAVMSNGEKIENPRYLKKSANRLAKLQKDMARKIYGSSNYEKNRIKVCKTYDKITNQTDDFLHKLTSRIISENQTIVIEGVGSATMLESCKISNINKSISEVSWGKFNTMLKYKAEWYGRNLIIADKHYPSSQLCSTCGYQNPLVKNLKVREWECPECRTVHDRDFNASLNLLSLAYINN